MVACRVNNFQLPPSPGLLRPKSVRFSTLQLKIIIIITFIFRKQAIIAKYIVYIVNRLYFCEVLPCGRIFSHSVYVYLPWGPVTEADLRPRPSMPTHTRLSITTQMAECYWSDESSPSLDIQIIGTERRANMFNIWTIWAKDRTSAQPQLNLSLLRRNSLKFQPLAITSDLTSGRHFFLLFLNLLL